MNIRGHIRRHWGTLVLLLVVAAAFARLAWVASQYETGWSVVADDWRPPLLRRLGLEYRPWYHREPAAQAEFLLAEVDRLLAEKPGDAATLMGCALLLDRPVDYDGTGSTDDDFEALCHKRCVELAAKATRREPDNVDWWRLRAQLQFRELAALPEPRSADWRSMLAECATHDADNALYGYLEARQLLHDAAHIEVVVTPGIVQVVSFRCVVDDEPDEREGMECLDRATERPFLAFGARGWPCVSDAVIAMNRSPAERVVVRRDSRDMGTWPVDLLMHSHHPLRVDAENGDVQAEASIIAQNLRIAAQLEAARQIDLPHTSWLARRDIGEKAIKLAAEKGVSLSATQVALAHSLQGTAYDDWAAYYEEAERGVGRPGARFPPSWVIVLAVGPSIVLPLATLAVVLLGIAVVLLPRQTSPPYRVHFVEVALIWLAAAAAVLATLGLRWPGIGLARIALAWLPALLVFGWIARWNWSLASRWRRGELQPRGVHLLAVTCAFGITVIGWLLVGMRTMAALVSVVPVEVLTISVVLFVLGAFFLARWLAGSRQAFEATIATLVALGCMVTAALAAAAPAGWYQVYVAERWHEVFERDEWQVGALSAGANLARDYLHWSSSTESLYNWYLSDGPFWTVVFALLLLAGWTLWRIGRARRRDPGLPQLFSAWAIGSLLRTLGLSCLAAAALCALPYLLLTPGHLPHADAYYQRVMRSP